MAISPLFPSQSNSTPLNLRRLCACEFLRRCVLTKPGGVRVNSGLELTSQNWPEHYRRSWHRPHHSNTLVCRSPQLNRCNRPVTTVEFRFTRKVVSVSLARYNRPARHAPESWNPLRAL